MEKTQQQFLANTWVLRFGLGRLGGTKKLDVDQLGTGDADKKSIHAQKDIMKSEEWRAVEIFDSKTKARIFSSSLPSLFTGGGWYIVPLARVEELDAYLTERASGRTVLVDALVAALPRIEADAERRLVGLLLEGEFPTAFAVREAYSQEHRWVLLETPKEATGVTAAILKREGDKAKLAWADAQQAAVDVLRAQMKALVDHMVERLTPGEDGKAKVFKGASVEKLSKFLADFAAMNAAGDADLPAIVDQARRLLEGVDAKQIRDQEGLRNAVALGVGEIKVQLDKLVGDKPARRINFDEEAV